MLLQTGLSDAPLTCAFPKSCTNEVILWQVTLSFHTAMERLGQLGLVERLSGDTVVETVEERIKEQVFNF